MRGRIIETNYVLENTPPPLFGLDVVYKIGGRINRTLRYTFRNFNSFADCLSISDRVVTVDADGTSHLAATLTQEIPGNVPWFMTDSIAVLEDGYSEVVVNVMALELKCSSSRRCRETTHDDHEQYWRSFVLL